jgi:hypothetical protein
MGVAGVSIVQQRHNMGAKPDSAAEARHLQSLISSCITEQIERTALYIRFSLLSAGSLRPYHMSLVESAIEPLLFADRARRFTLPNGDLVIVWRHVAEEARQRTVTAVRRLFAGDNEEMEPAAGIVLLLRLPRDAQFLSHVVKESLATQQRKPDHPVDTATTEGKPLDLATLAELEVALSSADMDRFLRRRPVCEALPDGTFHMLYEQRVLLEEDIVATLSPDRVLWPDKWLARRLRRTLDRRILALLSAPGELRGTGPFGLQLSVEAVLSAEFVRFDSMLPGSLRGEVIIELEVGDVMVDLPAFMFARDFAKGRGYLLQLGGVTEQLLDLFSLRATGLDLLALRCSPALLRRDGAETFADADHFVLTGADSPAAVAWGMAHGIRLFEGRMTAPGR